jgi:hypothetical protein
MLEKNGGITDDEHFRLKHNKYANNRFNIKSIQDLC